MLLICHCTWIVNYQCLAILLLIGSVHVQIKEGARSVEAPEFKYAKGLEVGMEV